MIAFIYYPLRERLTADLLRDLMRQDWPDALISELSDKLIDEHPLPLFSCQLPDSQLTAFSAWLQERHGMLSVLLQTDSGNGQWLGRKL